MNVFNKNMAIDRWNELVDVQTRLDSRAANTLSMVGDHLDTYNAEIDRSSPNYDLLVSNYREDKSSFDSWDADLSDLNNAIFNLSRTSGLSDTSKQDVNAAVTYMRTYHTSMQNAKIAYIAYCDDMALYVESAKKGNPDQSLIIAANREKDQANAYLKDAVDASNRATDCIKRLEG